MPVRYNIDKNNITTPPSYYARVEPIDTLGVEDVAEQISLNNPNLPVGTIVNIFNLFAEEVKNQLANGNWVKLENFCSFSSSMIGSRVSAADDPLPATAKVKIRVKPSAPFETNVRDSATYEKIGYINKVPYVAGAKTGYNDLNGILYSGYGLQLAGQHLEYDKLIADEGVFLQEDGAISATKQTNITWNKNARSTVVPTLTATSQGSVAVLASIKTRYTENGQLKTGSYSGNLRLVNEVASAALDQIIFKPYGGSSNIVVDAPAAAQSTLFSLIITSNNVLQIYGQLLDVDGIPGVASDPISITAAGDYVVNAGGDDHTFTVSNYNSLYANVESFGRFVQEVLRVAAP